MKKLTVIFLLFSYGSVAASSSDQSDSSCRTMYVKWSGNTTSVGNLLDLDPQEGSVAASSSDQLGKLRRTMSGDLSSEPSVGMPGKTTNTTSVSNLFDLDTAEERSFRLNQFAPAASGSDVSNLFDLDPQEGLETSLILQSLTQAENCSYFDEESGLTFSSKEDHKAFLLARELYIKVQGIKTTPASSRSNSLPQSRSATGVPVSSTPLLQESVTATPVVSSPLFPIPVLRSAIVALRSPENQKS